MFEVDRTAAPEARSSSMPMRFLRRQEGTTAIEFAIVAIPFFMFIFGLMGVSTYFFMMTSLEKGMDQASRLIRTGQAQTASAKLDGQTRTMTIGEFKRKICQKANSKADPSTVEEAASTDYVSGWIKCQDVQVFVKTFASWDQVTPQACVKNGALAINSANDSDPIEGMAGGANDIVLVTTCYKWRFASAIPYLNLGQTTDGSMVMQSATAFRTEPYAQ